MGWWGTDVMGGDTPLDILHEIAESCGLKPDWDNDSGLEGYLKSYPFTKENVEKNIEKIICTLVTGYEKRPDDLNIAYQVFGVVLMAVGADIPLVTISRIISAASCDEWAKEDDERYQCMQDFVKMLIQYKGKRTVYKSVSLMEKFTNRIESSDEKCPTCGQIKKTANF